MDIWIDIGLWITYIMMIVAVAAAVILPVIYALSDPKSLIGVGIGVAVILVLFFISYAISSDEITNPKAAANYGVTPSSAKAIGGSIVMMYILMFVAFVGIIFTEVGKLFR